MTKKTDKPERLTICAVVARLDSLKIGDRFKYNPNDVGIFEVRKKEEENWIETIRIQSSRRSGDFPWTEIYPL